MSVSYVAVELAQRIFSELTQQTVLIIGAGDMAELTLKHFKRAGISKILITNRTFANAVSLAEKYGGTALRFDQLEKDLPKADIILSSTGANRFILSRSMVYRCLRVRRGRSMFFIDIALPRDIDPEINSLPGAYCYDIDDLQNVVSHNQQERERQAELAEEILESEVEKFRNWFRRRSVVPMICSLRQHFHQIGDAELEKTLRKLNNLPQEQKKIIENFVHSLIHKLLHNPTRNLHHSSLQEDHQIYLDTIRELFELNLSTTDRFEVDSEGAAKEPLPVPIPPLKLIQGSRS